MQRYAPLNQKHSQCRAITDHTRIRRHQRRRRRRLVKSVYIYSGFSLSFRSIQCVCRHQNVPLVKMLRMLSALNRNTKKVSLTSSLNCQKKIGIWSFHVVDMQKTSTKCTKNYNARAQLLFCSLTFCLVTFSLPLPSCFAVFGRA